MRKSGEPGYRLDWEAWIAAEHGEQDFKKYIKAEDQGFDFAPPDAPWLLRWQNQEAV
jgi:hypothetical protein